VLLRSYRLVREYGVGRAMGEQEVDVEHVEDGKGEEKSRTAMDREKARSVDDATFKESERAPPIDCVTQTLPIRSQSMMMSQMAHRGDTYQAIGIHSGYH
jgi:hypothetical protein